MADMEIITSDWERTIAKDGPLIAENRYAEENPSLSPQNISFIQRPGLARHTLVGSGPIKGMYSSPGTFGDCLFVASGEAVYKLFSDGGLTTIYEGLNLDATYIPMTSVAAIGETPERMFFCDNNNLYVYALDSLALAYVAGTPANNDVIRIGDMYYKFTNTDVNAGTPLGTSGFPWLLALQLTAAGNYEVLSNAIDNIGEAGTEYSATLTPNAQAKTYSLQETQLILVSQLAGADGNAIATSASGGSTITSFTGGGGEGVTVIPMPDSVGVLQVANLNSYVIVIPGQVEDKVGRIYWVDPGEISVDPLNFATAESSSDRIEDIAIFNNQLWVFGTTSIESWHFTGDVINPFIPSQGINYDKGGITGTACLIENSLIFLSSDGGVLRIGTGMDRVSTRAIEEAVTKFLQSL